MLARELDQETKQLLAELSQQENVPSDELIKTLIRDRWQSLQQATGLHSSQVDRSDAEIQGAQATPAPVKPRNSKQAIAEFMRRKRFY